MKMQYAAIAKRLFLMAGLTAVFTTGSAFAQKKAIDFKQGMPFSGGYIAGNTLYVAGQQGPAEGGKLTNDISSQTTNAIAAIKKVVDAAGYKMSDIVSVTVYVTSLDDVPKMNEVYAKYFPENPPARSTVQAARLPRDVNVEIDAIAAIG